MNEPQLDTIYRGDTRVITVVVVDGDNSPIDITGQDITLTIAKYRQGLPIIEITNSTHFDGAGGISKFLLSADDTELLNIGLNHIDVVKDNAGIVNTLFLGTVRVENRVAVPE